MDLDIFNHLDPKELYDVPLWIHHNAWVYNRLNYPKEYGPHSLYYSNAKYLPIIQSDKYLPTGVKSIKFEIDPPEHFIKVVKS